MSLPRCSATDTVPGQPPSPSVVVLRCSGLTPSVATPGSYTLTVKAIDNRGAVTTSSAVPITVTNSPAQSVTLMNAGWAGADFIFAFASQAGRSYEVQQTTALGGTWQKAGTLAGTGGMLTFTNKNASGTQSFYRVETK